MAPPAPRFRPGRAAGSGDPRGAARPGPRLGACSWSFRPDGPDELVAGLRAAGLHTLQLGLKPLATAPWRPGWSPRRTARALAAAGLRARSGMVGTLGQDLSSPAALRATGGLVSATLWPRHRVLVRRWARLAGRLGLALVSFHAGCAAAGDAAARARLVERVRAVARLFARRGVRLALESGQEPAHELAALVRDVGHGAGVNLDPANFVLHGTGDPLEAVRVLAPLALQVHVKDADPPSSPGAWGRERAVGDGAVDWPACLALLGVLAPGVDLMIEREHGAQRVEDVRRAAALVRRHAPWLEAP